MTSPKHLRLSVIEHRVAIEDLSLEDTGIVTFKHDDIPGLVEALLNVYNAPAQPTKPACPNACCA